MASRSPGKPRAPRRADGDEPMVHAESVAAWRRWLKAHHAQPTGIWLVSWKAATGKPRMSYDEAVEEALCWGWVDSRSRALDDARGMLYFAPRKAGSAWSRINKTRVERLIAAGRMQPAGLAKVEAAKQDGMWSKLDAVEDLIVPPDLASAFRKHAGAKGQFDAFPRSVKRAILEWIGTAKKPETRAKRVEETARLAAQGIRANQWRQ